MVVKNRPEVVVRTFGARLNNRLHYGVPYLQKKVEMDPLFRPADTHLAPHSSPGFFMSLKLVTDDALESVKWAMCILPGALIGRRQKAYVCTLNNHLRKVVDGAVVSYRNN